MHILNGISGFPLRLSSAYFGLIFWIAKKALHRGAKPPSWWAFDSGRTDPAISRLDRNVRNLEHLECAPYADSSLFGQRCYIWNFQECIFKPEYYRREEVGVKGRKINNFLLKYLFTNRSSTQNRYFLSPLYWERHREIRLKFQPLSNMMALPQYSK